MSRRSPGKPDLLVVGAGPTGIAVGAAARRQGLEPLLVDQGPLTAAILGFPTYMTFFTSRDQLEVGDVPLSIPEEKPSRRQALVYYRRVVDHYRLPLALHEEVIGVTPDDGELVVDSRSVGGGKSRQRRVGAVVLATGYFGQPRTLGVQGEDLPWVSARYIEPYPHYGEDVVIVGAGNSAAEAALDLWRNGSRVTLVHRGASVKSSLKYWVKPDLENRIAEGSIAARFNSIVRRFGPGRVEIEGPGGRCEALPAAAAFVLIGYEPDVALQRGCGIEIDSATLVPTFDPESCESNVGGIYIAGTLQAGRDTGRIFIDNSRDHGEKIAVHIRSRLGQRRPGPTEWGPGDWYREE